MTISGSNFGGAKSVRFGTRVAAFTVKDDATIGATAPAGQTGPVDVTVTTAHGTSPVSSAGRFNYQQRPQAPTIVDVVPQGLEIVASWAPNPLSDLVGTYTATAKVASGYAGTILPGCASVPPTSAPGNATAAVLAGVCASPIHH